MEPETAYANNAELSIGKKPRINTKIQIIPQKITFSLSIIGSVLLILSLATNLVVYYTGHDYLHGIIPLFYVDRERNIPTGYSVFLLQFASVLLLVISFLKRRQSFVSSFYWLVLLLGFFLMSIDEAWSLHERIDQPGSFFDSNKYNSWFHFAWIIPFLFIMPLLLLFFLKFLRGLPKKTGKLFLISATLYIGGAIGLECIGGYIVETFGRTTWWYYITVTAEEGLEMSGLITFIYSLMNYLCENCNNFRLQFIDNNKSELPG